MGTPEFAVPTLRALQHSRHEVALVVTQPDRPQGRGRKLSASPVKRAAAQLGHRVFQPQSLKNDAVLQRLASEKPDFLVVIAYGHILSPAHLALARIGAINIHASLLPKYRGPAPIQWAIINGERETGVTTMLMDEGLDTGDILLTAAEPIGSEDTAATLHDRLAVIGAALLIETLDAFSADALTPATQDARLATYAPLLKKNDGHIDWRKPAGRIEAFIRGVTPWPGAFAFLNGKRLKVFRSQPLDARSDLPPGTVLGRFPGELAVATGEGVLSILEIQGASGKRLGIEDFLRGHPISPGEQLL